MHYNRHNPYFNRWFSAIKEDKSIKRYHIRHNPYFNRWFSAIMYKHMNYKNIDGHNPYFNRWFSAIIAHQDFANGEIMSQSLF